jgi:non-specific serine/threonine protein kinase
MLGEYDRAEEYFERSLAVGRDTGNPSTISHALQCLGSVAVMRGDLTRAAAYLHEAVLLLVELENGMFLGYCALHLAQVALAQADAARAATLLGAADSLWRADNSAIYPTYRELWRHACEAAAADLGERSFATIFAAGQRLSFEDAAMYAMTVGELDRTPSASSGTSLAMAPTRCYRRGRYRVRWRDRCALTVKEVLQSIPRRKAASGRWWIK